MNSDFCKLCFNPISTISEPSISINSHVKGNSNLLVSDLIRIHFSFHQVSQKIHKKNLNFLLSINFFRKSLKDQVRKSALAATNK